MLVRIIRLARLHFRLVHRNFYVLGGSVRCGLLVPPNT